MRYIHQHISHILAVYQGEMPLANFLKFYFKKNPILGSRDRKILSEMAYCYYRCAKGLVPKSLSMPEQIDAALLLADSHLGHIDKLLPEHLRQQYGKGFEENIAVLQAQGISFEFGDLLAQQIEFSEGISYSSWSRSLLNRPRLFIRVQQAYRQEVLRLLAASALDYSVLDDYCIALPNGTAIEKILPEQSYRIQDASSQKTAHYFGAKAEDACWDCCSGAGGKSLLVKDMAPKAVLSVSDVRKSILDNLAERFQLYQYPIPERLLFSVADEAATKAALGNRSFDHIIADVPCTGSGTWARTPEQAYFFDATKLPEFAERQQSIAHHALQYLKRGGTFVYITCSVFAAENEMVVQRLLSENIGIRLLQQELINGIGIAADSMFVAVLKREL